MTTLRIAHSPDADDAFMFYPLLQGKIDRPGLEITEVREEIESLNRKALEGAYEVTALSLHAYPYVSDKYLLLSTGACFGDRVGPVIVAAKPLKPKQLLKVRMGIPGKMTTAFLALKLYEHKLAGEGKSGICYSEVPFDQIMDQIAAGKLDAGLLIHEGQLTFAEKGLHKIVDLAEWWFKETTLPLPLGGIAIRRDLEPALQERLAHLIQESIRYALEHREEALKEALPYARGLDPEKTAEFVGRYVNEMTVEFGRKGARAIRTLFERAAQAGVLTRTIDLEDCLLDLRKGRQPETQPPVEVPSATELPLPPPEEAPTETTEVVAPLAPSEPTEEPTETTEKIPPTEETPEGGPEGPPPEAA